MREWKYDSQWYSWKFPNYFKSMLIICVEHIEPLLKNSTSDYDTNKYNCVLYKKIVDKIIFKLWIRLFTIFISETNSGTKSL